MMIGFQSESIRSRRVEGRDDGNGNETGVHQPCKLKSVKCIGRNVGGGLQAVLGPCGRGQVVGGDGVSGGGRWSVLRAIIVAGDDGVTGEESLVGADVGVIGIPC
ncbi:hypothetical protein L2E82_50892 [Cichorium intybus]|nr:hypothetical protein L2E82_50892 [Cichorium intybus]